MNLKLNLKKSNIMSVFIFLILLFILINRKTIFNSFLGRLLVIFALVGITSYNMLAGLLFVVDGPGKLVRKYTFLCTL